MGTQLIFKKMRGTNQSPILFNEQNKNYEFDFITPKSVDLKSASLCQKNNISPNLPSLTNESWKENKNKDMRHESVDQDDNDDEHLYQMLASKAKALEDNREKGFRFFKKIPEDFVDELLLKAARHDGFDKMQEVINFLHGDIKSEREEANRFHHYDQGEGQEEQGKQEEEEEEYEINGEEQKGTEKEQKAAEKKQIKAEQEQKEAEKNQQKKTDGIIILFIFLKEADEKILDKAVKKEENELEKETEKELGNNIERKKPKFERKRTKIALWRLKEIKKWVKKRRKRSQWMIYSYGVACYMDYTDILQRHSAEYDFVLDNLEALMIVGDNYMIIYVNTSCWAQENLLLKYVSMIYI